MEYIAVLPEAVASSSNQYLRLPHPRTGSPQLYLPYEGGLCEVVKVTGSKGRTWFIGDDKLAQGSMLIHQPFDPVFLAIPVAMSLLPSDGRAAHYQPLSDLLSTASGSAAFALRPAFAPTAEVELYNADVSKLIEHKGFRRAFRACCDRKLVDSGEAVAAAGESSTSLAYYRPSREAIVAVLKAKTDHLADPTTFNKFDHLVRGLGRDGLSEHGADEKVVSAARSKAAAEHIAQYITPDLLKDLLTCYDLLALNSYLDQRMAAAMAASAPVVQSSKAKTGEKRKAPLAGSRGVEALKKVNVKGMAKMTSFFKPKPEKQPA